MDRVDRALHTRIGRVLGFTAIAVAFSWAQWLAVIASQRGWIVIDVSLGPLAIFGPFVAALLIHIRASDDRRRWLASLFQWRIPAGVALVALFLPPLLLIGCLAIATGFTPGAPHIEIPSAGTVAAVFFGMFLTAGVGEESGWRGFLLPELRRSMGPLRASFIVAIVWFGWHLPLFWVSGATQQQIPPVAFALGILSYSCVLTWIVEAANDSTLAAMLFHSSANVCFWFAMVHVRHLPQSPLFSSAFVAAIVAIGAFAALLLACRDR
ncbi:MAG TPA: CPBP family intramembrane glutamic endopeptidase [Thermoanaerobaculia bacterium]|nr:CPBP family intramembrane glutamic endopeptidase [Thermoanaerobaculia bacterium]